MAKRLRFDNTGSMYLNVYLDEKFVGSMQKLRRKMSSLAGKAEYYITYSGNVLGIEISVTSIGDLRKRVNLIIAEKVAAETAQDVKSAIALVQ